MADQFFNGRSISFTEIKNMKLKHIVIITSWCWFVLAHQAWSAESSMQNSSEQAISADHFVDALGIGYHATKDDLKDWQKTMPQSAAALGALGIRHIRFDAHGHNDFAYVQNLYTSYGIRADMLFTSTTIWSDQWNNATNFLVNTPAVESIEGPNETDEHDWTYSKTSHKWPQGTMEMYSDMISAEHDAHSPYIIVAPCTGNPSNIPTLTQLGVTGDVANLHYYPRQNLPTIGMVEAMNFAQNEFSPVKPVWVTETGYYNAVNSPDNTKWNAVSERASGKYIPRLVADWIRTGASRVYLYELMDAGNDLSVRNQNFGLLHSDLSPKPAYTAMKNMISLLQEPGSSFLPHRLDYSLKGDTTNIHHLLLEKKTGNFYLLLWQNVQVYNSSSKGDLANIPVHIQLKTTSLKNANIYTFDDQGNLFSTQPQIANNEIGLEVPDSILIVEIVK